MCPRLPTLKITGVELKKKNMGFGGPARLRSNPWSSRSSWAKWFRSVLNLCGENDLSGSMKFCMRKLEQITMFNRKIMENHQTKWLMFLLSMCTVYWLPKGLGLKTWKNLAWQVCEKSCRISLMVLLTTFWTYFMSLILYNHRQAWYVSMMHSNLVPLQEGASTREAGFKAFLKVAGRAKLHSEGTAFWKTPFNLKVSTSHFISLHLIVPLHVMAVMTCKKWPPCITLCEASFEVVRWMAFRGVGSGRPLDLQQVLVLR